MYDHLLPWTYFSLILCYEIHAGQPKRDTRLGSQPTNLRTDVRLGFEKKSHIHILVQLKIPNHSYIS